MKTHLVTRRVVLIVINEITGVNVYNLKSQVCRSLLSTPQSPPIPFPQEYLTHFRFPALTF